MLRKALVALAAAAAIGIAFIPTESMARPGGGFHSGGVHGGFAGRGFAGHGFAGRGFAGRGFAGHGFRGRFFTGYGLGFYGPYAYYPDYTYDGCYRLHRVLTPYGWRWRRIYVCY